MGWKDHMDANRITFRVMDHKDMDGVEVVNKLNKAFQILHGKPIFFFDEKPYQTGRIVENPFDDGTDVVYFRWHSLRSARGILNAYYGESQFEARSQAIKVEDITGYDIVDAYYGTWYIGTYERITTKDGSKRYGKADHQLEH